jgi:predicted dehydrogenase
MVKHKTSRREFLRNSAMAGVGIWIGSAVTLPGAPGSPNEKLNIACIGCGGKGESDTLDCRGENIVALCDVDGKNAKRVFEILSNVPKFTDYRKMLERKDIDAVTVSTPDHHHAPAAMIAIQQGRHVFVQKPLTKTVKEARMLREGAKKHKVATQMGNQGTSSSGLRQGVEVIQSGAIGHVREIHVWTNRPVWDQGSDKFPVAPKAEPVPEQLAWNEWLGPAADRPYSSKYCPFSWRGFWDFGTGALGDMACHTANLPFWACKLEYPVAIEREVMVGNNEITYPTYSKIRFDFPARGELPPLKFFWYDGWTIKDGKKVHNTPSQETFKGLVKRPANSGCLLIGDKGMLYSPDDYGSDWQLLPEKDFDGYKPPTPWIERSPGHMKEWHLACKGGKPAMSNFDYAALLTETILLGNLALKVDGKIEWDGPNMRSPNAPKANEFTHYEYRKGWL